MIIKYQYLTDAGFVPCEADREFMQAITLLYPYFIRNDDGLPMLPVACFIPLMYQHPYFMYTIEQKWNLYRNCHVDHSATMQNILESLFRSYQDPKKFMKFQKEWLPLSQGALKRTTADLHELEIACSELFDIVKPHKPREADTKSVEEPLSSSKLKRWYDFLAGKRYDVLFSAMQFFFGSTTIYLWLISLTASKELSILLLKLYNDGAIGISASFLGLRVRNVD